jgi:hypothetical protein
MADGCRGMVSGSGRPSGGGQVWAARPGGDGAVGRVVEDVRWRVSATGASNHIG